MKFGETIMSIFSDEDSGENKVEKRQREGETTTTGRHEKGQKLGQNRCKWEGGDTENTRNKNRSKVPLKSAQRIAFSLEEEESYSQHHKLQPQIHKSLFNSMQFK